MFPCSGSYSPACQLADFRGSNRGILGSLGESEMYEYKDSDYCIEGSHLGKSVNQELLH